MDLEKSLSTTKDLIIIGAVGFGAFQVWKFLQGVRNNPTDHPTAAATLNYWFPHFLKPGTQVPDTTNDVGSNLLVGGVPLAAAGVAVNAYDNYETKKLQATTGPKTQYAYQQALTIFAEDHGFPNGATAAASDQWPYTPTSDPTDMGFADWVAQGYPDLSSII